MTNFKLVAAALIVFAPFVHPAWSANGATAPPAHKRYVSFDVGDSRMRGEFSDSFLSQSPGADTTANDTGFRISFGYQFNRYLAVEVGYADFGEFEFGFDPDNCPPTFPGGSCDVTAHTTLRGPLANVVGLIPLNDRWVLKGRAGLFRANVSNRQTGPDAPTPPPRSSDENTGLHFGAGVSYRFNDNLDLEVAWTYYEQIGLGVDLGGNAIFFTEGSSSLGSVGLAYRF